MPTITEITKFQTEDGHQFDTMGEAQSHNEQVELALALKTEFGGMVSISDSMDIALWLIENYVIAKKG